MHPRFGGPPWPPNYLIMRKIYLFITCFLLSTNLHAEECFIYQSYLVTASVLYLRSGPTQKSKPIVPFKRTETVESCMSTDHPDTIDGQRGYWYQTRLGELKGWAFSAYLREFLKFEPAYTQSSKQTQALVAMFPSYASALVTRSALFKTSCLIDIPQGAPVLFKISDRDDFLALSPGTDVFRQLIFVNLRDCSQIPVTGLVELDPGIWKDGVFVYRQLRDTGNFCYEWNVTQFFSGKATPTGQKGKYPKGSQGCG